MLDFDLAAFGSTVDGVVSSCNASPSDEETTRFRFLGLVSEPDGRDGPDLVSAGTGISTSSLWDSADPGTGL